MELPGDIQAVNKVWMYNPSMIEVSGRAYYYIDQSA